MANRKSGFLKQRLAGAKLRGQRDLVISDSQATGSPELRPLVVHHLGAYRYAGADEDTHCQFFHRLFLTLLRQCKRDVAAA